MLSAEDIVSDKRQLSNCQQPC